MPSRWYHKREHSLDQKEGVDPSDDAHNLEQVVLFFSEVMVIMVSDIMKTKDLQKQKNLLKIAIILSEH